MTTPEETILATVKKLLQLAKEQDEWHEKIQASEPIEINDPISGDYKLVHLALDTLGYPPDNEPNDMDDWDDDIRWCRDGAIDQFNEMILKNNDIDGFIRAVQEAVASPLPIAERRPFSFSRS